MRPVYTVAQVAAHNKDDDCWVIVHGKVLDVSLYMAKHPGGKPLIFRSAGQDVTKDFEAMFHSVRARAKLDELVVGDVAGASAALLSPWSVPANKLGSRAASAAPGPGRGPYGLGPPQSGVAKLPGRPVALKTDEFTALTVVATRVEGVECRVLTLALPNNGTLGIKPSQHVRVRHGDLVRSYTPVAWKAGSFDLLVKPYPAPAGTMSRFLCGLRSGEEVEVCGPCGDFVWERQRLVLLPQGDGAEAPLLVLAGIGTGVTPLAQLIRGVQDCDWSRGRRVRVALLLGMRSAAHALCVKQLAELSALSGGLLSVTRFESDRGARLTPDAARAAVGADAFRLAALIAVCGTDQFVDAFREAAPSPDRFHAF